MPIEIHATNTYVLATIREDIRRGQFNEIQSCFTEAQNNKVKAIILDMVGVGQCEDLCLQELVVAAQNLRTKNILVYVVRLNHFMQAKISRGGLGQILIYKESVDHILESLGINTKSKSKLDSELIKPILDAMIKVITEKSHTELKPGRVFSKVKDDTFKGDVITVLGVVSSTFNGSFAIAFGGDLFAHITTSIAGELETTESQDTDTGNALLNLISLKSNEELSKKKFSVQQFIPLVIRGEKLDITEIIPNPLLIFPFDTHKGHLQIYVGLNSD